METPKNSHYVAWVPPNPHFEDTVCDGTHCDSLSKAQEIAHRLNLGSRDNLGTYEARLIITPA